MNKVRKIQFDIFRAKDKKKWIIKRRDGEYSQHSHFSNPKGCYIVRRQIQRGVLPTNSTYLIEAIRRLLTEEEFNSLKKEKPRYHNSRKKKRDLNKVLR